ncbi:MAG: hypothetical protein ACXWUG_07905 [Polyangiales bacterium]
MRFEIAFIASVALALGACPGTLDEGKFAGAGTCTDPVKEIFTPTCAVSGCHSTADSDASGKLDLEAPNVADRLRGKKAFGGAGFLIDTTNPEQSVIITKLKSPVPFGSRMPLGLAALDSVKQKCIHDWAVANATGGSPPDSGGDETSDDAASDAGADSSTDASMDDAPAE